MNVSPIFSRLLFLFCLAAMLASCGDNGANTARQERSVPVVIAKVTKRDVPRTLAAVGNVQPAASVAVKPQVGGQIVAVPVSSGQDVTKGQILFQIDPRPYEANVREVQARLLRDQVLLKKAEEDQARFSRLVKQDAISREQYDQAVANANSQRALVVQDEASLAWAKLQLEYATIRAPVSGRIGEVLLDEGNVVKANDDRTLLVINTLAPAKIIFAVPERYLPEIMAQFTQSSITVTATPEGFTKNVSTGRLTSIDNTVDVTTGTIKLEATFDNKDHKLWPGQFTRITVDLATLPDTLVISASAVLEGIIGQYVYVVDEKNTAQVRKVTARFIAEGEMMIEEGLKEGMRVVTDGQLNLAAGVAVTERNPDGSAPAPASSSAPGSGSGS
ncbi:efflux RND transporter periplasmic adaptor subunit [Desulfovibrio sp. OttesenSCG-928-O18]|nr:efflux RND transporter periplasmic adaptor subunit [Desulfovibrio sp. OttesenSCG-928-O18]